MSYWREGKEQVIYLLKNVPFSRWKREPSRRDRKYARTG
jgi:hypothetical protein